MTHPSLDRYLHQPLWLKLVFHLLPLPLHPYHLPSLPQLHNSLHHHLKLNLCGEIFILHLLLHPSIHPTPPIKSGVEWNDHDLMRVREGPLNRDRLIYGSYEDLRTEGVN